MECDGGGGKCGVSLYGVVQHFMCSDAQNVLEGSSSGLRLIELGTCELDRYLS